MSSLAARPSSKGRNLRERTNASVLQPVDQSGCDGPDEALPETSDATEDLRRWANAIAAAYRSDEEAALLRAGAAGAGEATSDCLRDRLDEAARLASRIPGLAGDDVVNHVVAPIICRVIFLPWTLTDTTATELVNAPLEQL